MTEGETDVEAPMTSHEAIAMAQKALHAAGDERAHAAIERLDRIRMGINHLETAERSMEMMREHFGHEAPRRRAV